MEYLAQWVASRVCPESNKFIDNFCFYIPKTVHSLCESLLIFQVGIFAELTTKISPAVYCLFLPDVLLFEYFVIFGTSLF